MTSPIQKVLEGSDVEETSFDMPSDITALVRRQNKILSMPGLVFTHLQRLKHGCLVRLSNPNNTMEMMIAIDFEHRLLAFNPLNHSATVLNKQSRSSLKLAMELREMNWLYMSNGRLELWDTDSDEPLGMTEECIPVNMHLDPKSHRASMDELQSLYEVATED